MYMQWDLYILYHMYMQCDVLMGTELYMLWLVGSLSFDVTVCSVWMDKASF